MAGRAQERIASARAPSFRERFFSPLGQPVSGADPRLVENAVVTISHGARNGLHFAEIRTAVRDVAQRPGSERVVQIVFKE